MSKLRFTVCYHSGEEPEYPAEELNVHSPHTRGWQSAHFCDYPQELGLGIESPARVTQVQILSHQNKIATQIELFMGHGDTYESAQFRRLGYLRLNSNERSKYAARELKSVYVNALGQYLRMLVHKCYINEVNIFNQVGIVAVNLIGETLGKLTPGAPGAASALCGSGSRARPLHPQGHNGKGQGLRRPKHAEMNDLSSDVKFDAETAQRISDITAAKERAVRSEDYDRAKLLKEAETQLKSLGQKLAQLDVAKRQAVEDEDYDRAKMLKVEAEALRLQIAAYPNPELPVQLEEADVNGDLGNNNVAPVNRSFNERPGGSGDISPGELDLRSPSIELSGPSGLEKTFHSVDRPIATRGSGERQGRPGVSPDERIVQDSGMTDGRIGFGAGSNAKASPPTVKPRPLHAQEEVRPHVLPRESWEREESEQADDRGVQFPPGEHPLEGVPNMEDLAVPETLSAKVDLSEVQGLNSVFGEYITRCLYSKAWSLREAAILKVKLMLPSLEEDPGINSALTEICQVLRVGFEDKIAQVFLTTLCLLDGALASIEGCRQARHNHVVAALEPTVATLLNKLGDSQIRLRDGAMNGLVKVARCRRTAGPGFVSHVALKPMVKKQLSAWRPIKSRLNLLRQIVSEFGLEGGSDLTIEGIMGFVQSCNAFAHSNAEVRDAARELTVELHGIVGTDIERYLTCLRPKQLDEYHEAFRLAEGETNGRSPGMPPPPSRTTPRRPHAERSPRVPKTSPKTARSVETNNKHAARRHHDGRGSPVKQASPAKSPQDDFSVGDYVDNDVTKDSDAGEDVPKTCQFCGKYDLTFTKEKLDVHLFKHCPMLMSCNECKQVIEIRCMTDHLLDECKNRESYEECDISFLAIRVEELDEWQRSKSCKPPGKGGVNSACPLCFEHVGSAGDSELWRAHLIEACPRNPRS